MRNFSTEVSVPGVCFIYRLRDTQKSISPVPVSVADCASSALRLPRALFVDVTNYPFAMALCWGGWRLVEGLVGGTGKQKWFGLVEAAWRFSFCM